MNSINRTSIPKDRRMILSTLWIFVTANYIFCDVLSNMYPEHLNAIIKGQISGITISQEFLFGSAIFMEIPFVMILLSRVLNDKANRLTNIIAGTIMTVAQIGSLFVGTATLHYIFYSIIEIGTTLLITWIAFSWHNIQNHNN